MNISERLDKCTKDKDGQPLVCYGCAHSAAYMRYSSGEIVEGTDFPGRPSGERPCCFCVRNPERKQWADRMQKEMGFVVECWYDGSEAVKIPMDCYYSLDFGSQMDKWKNKK